MSNELIRKVLGEKYLSIDVCSIRIDDTIHGGCTVNIGLDIEQTSVLFESTLSEGVDQGMVDAVFSAFKYKFSKEYESLKHITLKEFKVTLKRVVSNVSSWSEVPGADRACEAEITVKNSYGRDFFFAHTSHSLTAAVVKVMTKAVEHFINAERAYVALHVALEDARDRERADLVSRYILEMSEVVKLTSYAEVRNTDRN